MGLKFSHTVKIHLVWYLLVQCILLQLAECQYSRETLLSPVPSSNQSPKLVYFHPKNVTSRSDVDSTSTVPWEDALKETVNIALKEENVGANFNSIKHAPYIGTIDLQAKKFGDIVVLAQGKLKRNANNSYTFVQNDVNCDRNCDVEKLDQPSAFLQNITALWMVERIRHRDPLRGHRYDLKFTVVPIFQDTTDQSQNMNDIKQQSQRKRTFILRDTDYPTYFQAIEIPQTTSRRNGDSIFTPSTFFTNAFERTMSLNPLMQQLFSSMSFLAPVSPYYNKPHLNVGEIFMQPLPSVMPKYHHNMHHHYYPGANYVHAQPLIQHENRIKFPESKEQMLKNYYKHAYAHQHQYRFPPSKPIVFEKEMLHETPNNKFPIVDHRGAVDNILGKNHVTFKDTKDGQNGQSSQIQQQVQLGPILIPQIVQNQQNTPNLLNQGTQSQPAAQNQPVAQNLLIQQNPPSIPNIPLVDQHTYNHQNKHNPNLVPNPHANAHIQHQIKHSFPSVPQPVQQSPQQSQINLQQAVKNQIQVYPSQITATPITTVPMPVVIQHMPFIQMSQAPYTVQFHHMAAHNNQFYVHQPQPDLGTTIRYMQPLHLGVMSNNVFVPPFQYLPNHKYTQPTGNPNQLGGISTFKPSNPIHNHHIQHNHNKPHSQNQQNNYIRFGNIAKNHTKAFTESEKHTTVKFSDLDPVFHPHTTPKAKTTSAPNQFRASSQINQQIDSPISTASSVNQYNTYDDDGFQPIIQHHHIQYKNPSAHSVKFGNLEHNSVELSLAATVATHKPDLISVTLPQPEKNVKFTPIARRPIKDKKVFGDKLERVKEVVARIKKLEPLTALPSTTPFSIPRYSVDTNTVTVTPTYEQTTPTFATSEPTITGDASNEQNKSSTTESPSKFGDSSSENNKYDVLALRSKLMSKPTEKPVLKWIPKKSKNKTQVIPTITTTTQSTVIQGIPIETTTSFPTSTSTSSSKISSSRSFKIYSRGRDKYFARRRDTVTVAPSTSTSSTSSTSSTTSHIQKMFSKKVRRTRTTTSTTEAPMPQVTTQNYPTSTFYPITDEPITSQSFSTSISLLIGESGSDESFLQENIPNYPVYSHLPKFQMFRAEIQPIATNNSKVHLYRATEDTLESPQLLNKTSSEQITLTQSILNHAARAFSNNDQE